MFDEMSNMAFDQHSMRNVKLWECFFYLFIVTDKFLKEYSFRFLMAKFPS